MYAFFGSLTSEGDLLSQWRGYNRGRGFAVGFNEDWLKKNAVTQNFEISPVMYDADEQRAAADAVVQLLVVQLSNVKKENELELMNGWRLEAVRTALRLKDQHFSEEKESRLVWIANSWPRHVETRTTTAGLIPYQVFRFDLDRP